MSVLIVHYFVCHRHVLQVHTAKGQRTTTVDMVVQQYMDKSHAKKPEEQMCVNTYFAYTFFYINLLAYFGID